MHRLLAGLFLVLCWASSAFSGSQQVTSNVDVAAVKQDPFSAVRLSLATARTELRKGDMNAARVTLGGAWESFLGALDDEPMQLESPALGIAAGIANLAGQALDFELARAAWQWTVDASSEALAPDDLDLQAAKLNLGAMLAELGDELRARALWEDVLEVYSQRLQPGDMRMISLQMNLSIPVAGQGDRLAARTLLERARVALQEAWPADTLTLAKLHLVLAGQVFELGDVRGAAVLYESALRTFKAALPDDHEFVLLAKQGLGAISFELGDANRALELFEEVLGRRESTMPENSLQLLLLRNNVAQMLAALGDLEDSRELLEEVLAGFEENHSADISDRLLVETSLAETLIQLGELEEALSVLGDVLETFDLRQSGDIRALVLSARAARCEVLLRLGRLEKGQAEVGRLAQDLRRWAADAQLFAPRESMEHVDSAFGELSLLLSLCSGPDVSVKPALLFELLEAFRATATGGALSEGRLNEAALEARARASRVRWRIQQLAAAPRGDEAARGELQMAILERDRFESEFRKQVERAGMSAPPVTVRALAAQLGKRGFAAGYRVYQRTTLNPDATQGSVTEPAMLAFVLFSDGVVRRVELGSLARISAAVQEWRTAIGAPITGTKHPTPSAKETQRAASLALRALILDPLIALGAGRDQLHVCLDGPLHLVPLDALLRVAGADSPVQVHSWVTFAGLQNPQPVGDAEPSMLIVGGIDYGIPEHSFADSADDAEAEVSADVRVTDGALFAALPGTGAELEALATLFRDTHQREPVVLRGTAASKSSFAAQAPRLHFLHLATHGFIADERVRSWTDSFLRQGPESNLPAADSLLGMAPMTLCGLAFAGANGGASAAARMPGLLTAEELAGLDLSECELAVLSACETHVGVARAGQGLQSIHGAMHAAGARTTLSSLWKVNDERARDLIVEFYTHLWVDGLSKAEALRAAQRSARRKRHPTRDWAGWVLIGDPR